MSDSDQTITEVTRRAIIDYLSVSAYWAGALEDHEFLGRIYDLERMPSTDYRRDYNTAYLDIWQHRIRNQDWPDNWVFTDSRFDLLYGPDEPFLKFLAETVHPVVRPNSDKASEMVKEYNSHLGIDGWELYVVKEISKKPAFGYRVISAPMAESQAHQPKAFVSHATQDHPFVEKFATDLRAHGIAAWFSKWEIKPGDSIPSKIDEGLEECEYFIIVLSKNSIGRPWVHTELDAATMRKNSGKVRKIIPVKIEDCGDLRPTLASLCWEDFSNQPYDSALKRVLDSIFEVDVRPPLGTRPTSPLPVEWTTNLPERRPKLAPEYYGRSPQGREGLSIKNDGDPAYDVRIEAIPLTDECVLHFDDIIDRLHQEGFFKAIVSQGNAHSLDLDTVWRRLWEAKAVPGILPVTITYRDFDGRKYRSKCELHRDVMKSSGFAVKFVRQEIEPVR